MIKKTFLLCIVIFLMLTISAQNNRPAQTATSIIPNKAAKFLLFPTQNYHIFLKLNTRTGEVFMVQFSLEEKEQFETKIESKYYPLAIGEEQVNGRFYLYPTTNIFNFMLLDQIDGRVWQVQWNFDKAKCFLTRVYNDKTPFNKVLIKELEFVDGVYFKDGELYSGIATSNDGVTLSKNIFDGRFLFDDIFSVNHSNGHTAITFSIDKGIENAENNYYDENGEVISLEIFKNKYPTLIPEAKKALKDFNRNQ